MVMNCLIDFLTDEKQKKLINMVQNREETFENGLESYKKLFMVEIEHCIGKCHKNLEKHHHDTTSSSIDYCLEFNSCKGEDCQFPDACSQICDVLQNIKKKKIEHFFDGIRHCYIYWIDSQTTRALEAFESLLKRYGLINDGKYNENDELLIKNLTERVFFRGRVTDEFLGKMDMFHVPYNKRYNLCNERFSLTGQPSLYLGNSIADIVEELGMNITDEENMKRLKISSFEFSDTENEKKIFDLRCSIWKDMRNIIKPSFSEKKFFRNILSIICSFQKRKGLEEYVFKEEYVIPQMLAQILKQNHYDGICYYSTKRFYKYHLEADSPKVIESEINMNYRENVALFTKIIRNESQFYDKNLHSSLEISMPLNIRNIKESSEEELYNIYNSIEKHYQEICMAKKQTSKDNSKECKHNACEQCFVMKSQKKADSIWEFYRSTFSKLKFDNKLYVETDLGKLHLQLLMGILNRILVESEISNTNYQADTQFNFVTEMLQCCDIFGKDTVVENSKDVHENGKLHKGQIIFIIRNGKSFSEIQVPLYKKTQDTLFYGHKNSIEHQFREQGFILERAKERIGAFVYRDISMTEWPQTEFALKTNFEYVEVFLSEIIDKDNPNTDLDWYSLEELRNQLTEDYNKFSKVYQQALLILLNHFYNKDK